jgi:hypothetical protein
MNSKEIYNKLPASWNDVSLGLYQKLTRCQIHEDNELFNGIHNTLEIVSKATDIPVEELEGLPMVDLMAFGTKLSFMAVQPVIGKDTGKLKVKDINKVTYNEFIEGIQLKDNHLENLNQYVRIYADTNLTNEEILQLPVIEVLSFFFSYQEYLKKYTRHLIRKEKMKLVRLKAKENFQMLKRITLKLKSRFIK